jgi:hypothetical protein
MPCATCGTTRLAHALLHGDLGGALAANPLALCALVLLAAWAALSVRWRVVLAPRERAALVVLGAAALIANWTYLVLRGL